MGNQLKGHLTATKKKGLKAPLFVRGFSAQMFIRRTELSVTTKLSAEHETPPIANVLLAVRCSFSSNLSIVFSCKFIKAKPF